MKQFVLLVLLVSSLAFPPAAHACFCVTPDLPEAFASAKAVFLGDVTEIIEPRSADEKAAPSLRLFVIKFKVVKSWKGIGFASQEISVLRYQGRSGCFTSPTLQKGLRYLVFADAADNENSCYLGFADAADSENGASIVGACNRTHAVRPGLAPSRVFDADDVDPFFDMKQLDALLTRPRAFDDSSFRRHGEARWVFW